MQWLLHLAAGEPADYAEIGRDVAEATGRPKRFSGQVVSGWGRRDLAPNTADTQAGLVAFLQVTEAWLIEGDGEPPRKELWPIWSAAREKQREQAPEQAEPIAVVAKRSRTASRKKSRPGAR